MDDDVKHVITERHRRAISDRAGGVGVCVECRQTDGRDVSVTSIFVVVSSSEIRTRKKKKKKKKKRSASG